MTAVTSIRSSSARRYPVRIAAPTPRLRSCSSNATRGSPTARAAATVPSREASSTTRIRSTKSGIERIVSAISFSSSCAGTTTATRCPSSPPPRLGAVADGPPDRLPEERGEDPEQEPEQGRDDHRVTAALRRGLGRHRECLLLPELDLLRHRKLLRRGGELIGDLGALDRDDQLVRRGEPALPELIVDRLERLRVGGDLLLPARDQRVRVGRSARDDDLRERVRRDLD